MKRLFNHETHEIHEREFGLNRGLHELALSTGDENLFSEKMTAVKTD